MSLDAIDSQIMIYTSSLTDIGTYYLTLRGTHSGSLRFNEFNFMLVLYDLALCKVSPISYSETFGYVVADPIMYWTLS